MQSSAAASEVAALGSQAAREAAALDADLSYSPGTSGAAVASEEDPFWPEVEVGPAVGEVSGPEIASVPRWSAAYRATSDRNVRFALLALCWNATPPAGKLAALHRFLELLRGRSTGEEEEDPTLAHLTEDMMLPLPLRNYAELFDVGAAAGARDDGEAADRAEGEGGEVARERVLAAGLRDMKDACALPVVTGVTGSVPRAPVAFFLRASQADQVRMLEAAWKATPVAERSFILRDVTEFYGRDGIAVKQVHAARK